MTRTHEFNLTGAARKPLIEAIESFTNTKGVYQGVGKFGYAFHGVGVLDKAGALHLDCDLQVIMDLITWLENCGFACDTPATEETPDPRTYQAELSDPDCSDRMEVFSADDDADAVRQAREFCEGKIVLLEIFELDGDYNQIRGIDLSEFPPETITLELNFPDDTDKRGNLLRLIHSKANIIKTALGADGTGKIPMEFTDDGTVRFEWLWFGTDSLTIEAWSAFLAAAVRFSLKAKRITAKEKAVENEKFAFRTFLVKIGMNDISNKDYRRQLLRNLSGDAAFATAESRAKWQAKHLKNTEVTGNVE